MKNPSMASLYTNQGGREGMIGTDGVPISITIDGTRLGTLTTKTKITAPHLYARTTASPYKARPFMMNAAIANPTNTTNATVDIPDADAVKFKVGDSVGYFDVSAGNLHTESKTISAIGAAGSGGAGETLVTLTGVWTTPPVAADLLVVADGTHLSANVVVVVEDIDFDGTNDHASRAFVEGVFQKSKVGNTTLFDETKQQGIRLINLQ